MSNTSIALLLAGAVTIGTIDAAWTAPNTAQPSAPSMPRTTAPLTPGGAAGVKQAQGMDWSGPLLGAAVTGGIFLAMVLLIDTDDDGPVTSTGTAP